MEQKIFLTGPSIMRLSSSSLLIFHSVLFFPWELPLLTQTTNCDKQYVSGANENIGMQCVNILQWMTKVVETRLEDDSFRYMTSYSISFASRYPRTPIKCCVGAVVCYLCNLRNRKIDIVWRKGEMFQRRSKIDTHFWLTAKCLNTFVPHCSLQIQLYSLW